MSNHVLPRYPVYIPSKGRADLSGHAAQCLDAGGVPFSLVVEPTEADAYAARFGRERLVILPFHDLGLGSIPARNFIWEHAKASGAKRHWTLDDNVYRFVRRYHGRKIPCEPGIALSVCEDFTDRYENIAITGLNYEMFVPDGQKKAPLQVNCHVYSCMLIDTNLPLRWRGRYNEDTDLCLQVLAAGWCTVLLNTFLAWKPQTMTRKGGNTAELYQGDGRLKMARSLERMWPGVVTVDRRFHRPQHVVNWKKFDTPLRLKPGIDLSALPAVNEYGMSLVQVKDEIKSPRIQGLLDDWQQSHMLEVPADA